MITQPQISTLFPYTTLFRSELTAKPGLIRARTDDQAARSKPKEARQRGARSAVQHAANFTGKVERPTVLLVVEDRKSTRLNSSHRCISYAVFCLKKKKKRYW